MKFRYLTRIEKILVIFLLITFFVSFAAIGNRFYISVSHSAPAEGGVYSEGMVGKMQFLNPVFADLNPVDKDISSLIFSGLMRYNTETGNIEDDLAVHTLDASKKNYTFTIKDNAKWHDGVPVTADDIMFTFQEVIQNVEFSNAFLRENFKGVVLRKVDEKTVTFTLEKPYKFFLTNLVVGLLPNHLLSDIPVKNLHFSEFNYLNPIGTGPYKLVSIDALDNSQKVVLTRNTDFYGTVPRIEEFDVYVFPSYELLQNSLELLDGIQSVDVTKKSLIESNSYFSVVPFYLPQYVAAFFNTESKILKDKKVRLALALATDQEKVLHVLKDVKKVDTPFLELDASNWLLQFDTTKAQGSLNDAAWKLPWKQEVNTDERNEKMLEQQNTEEELLEVDPLFITAPSNKPKFATSQTEFFIEGTVPEGTKEVFVNNYKLNLFNPSKLSFSYKASVNIGTLKNGENVFAVEITNAENTKEALDAIIIFHSVNEADITAKQTLFDKEFEEKEQVQQKILQKKNQLEDEATVVLEKELEANLEQKQYRINNLGEVLELEIITAESQKDYISVAEELQKMWVKVGIKTVIHPLPLEELQQRVGARDYDILIFGQSLGYNHDSYPYWHSSQAKNGFNFSQLKNFEVDTLLEEIRSTHDEDKRQEKLEKLEKALIEEMPAIFLYTPERYFAISNRIKGINFINLQDSQDRFSSVSNWYVNEKYSLEKTVSVSDFFNWIVKELKVTK